jgi:hypothetical protein
VVWLIGKVQGGKTSIIRALTGASDAEIGASFRACTQTARIFDFPAEAPIIRFLDTRGLGEVAYDPAEDIAFCEGRSHLILVVMKARDFQQEAVIEALRAARRRHPDWPVVVAQTSLPRPTLGRGPRSALSFPRSCAICRTPLFGPPHSALSFRFPAGRPAFVQSTAQRGTASAHRPGRGPLMRPMAAAPSR